MTILLAQDWDIILEVGDEYEAFITQAYIPKCEALGLKSVGGFYVEVGFGPRIVSIKSTESLNELMNIMSSKEFKTLHSQLREYVVSYQSRILEPTGRVKHNEYKIQRGVWKFNQYYDLIPGLKKEYADFIVTEYLATLAQFDYVEVTGGWNVLVGGICEIIAELTFKSPVDIGRMFEDERYKRIAEKLQRNYVIHHRTRIMRTTERYEQTKWYRL
jgi:hypothetical protein